MTREEKVTEVSALHERLVKANLALVATNKGLTVAQATTLRRKLRAAGGEYKVAKHTLLRRALADTRFGAISNLLEGPRALVLSYADPIAVAKALIEFVDSTDKLAIDGGALEGQALRADQVKALATMPGLDQLRGRVVRQALSPGARLVASVTAPAARIAGAIEALVKKLEAGSTPES